MFACVANERHIHIFNFYTGETTERMMFQGHHTNRVMNIDWFANDMGFASCGLDGNIYFFDLYQKEIGERNKSKEINKKVKFTSVVNLPNMPYEFLAVGSEKVIYTETDKLKSIPRQTSVTDVVSTTPQLPELKHHLSQLVIHHSGKILFAGVGEQSEVPYPGAIQVWKLPFEKAVDI